MKSPTPAVLVLRLTLLAAVGALCAPLHAVGEDLDLKENYSLTTLASDVPFMPPSYRDNPVSHIAVHGDHVFWTDASEFPLKMTPRSGGAVTSLATRLDSVENVAVTADRLVWLDQRDGSSGGCTGSNVRRLLKTSDLDGSGVTTLADASNCAHTMPDLVVDGSDVYWVSSSIPLTGGYEATIRKVALDGSASESLAATTHRVFGIAVDDGHVYWEEERPDSSAIMRVGKTGGEPEELATDLDPVRGGVVVLGGQLYFATSDYFPSHTHRILTLPVSGGVPTTLATISGDTTFARSVRRLIASPTHLYWLDADRLNMLPIGGGSPTALLTGLQSPSDLLLTGTSLVFSETTQAGRIRTVPVAGGEAVTLAEAAYPSRLFLQGDSLFWAELGDGASPGWGRIARVPVAGGDAHTVLVGVAGDFPAIATDGVNVVVGDVRVKKFPIAGGMGERLAGEGGDHIATDGEHVYTLTRSFAKVVRTPVDGGPATTLYSTFESPVAMALGSGVVFWVEDSNRIKGVATTGGPAFDVAGGDQYGRLSDIVADATDVYFSSVDTGKVYRVPATGGSVMQFGLGEAASWNLLAQDEDELYWMNQTRILKLDKLGGVTETVAGDLVSDATFPNALAVDDENGVVFTDTLGQRVRKATANGEFVGSFQFGAASYSVNESLRGVTITVTRKGGSGYASVDYEASDGTADRTSDYSSVFGTLTFPPGIKTRTFGVPVYNDRIVEGPETVHLTLSRPTNYHDLGEPGTALLTITSDDAGGRVRVASDATNTPEKSGVVRILVTRSGGFAADVTVKYATIDGSALAGSDYEATSGTLTFAAGQTSALITVPVLDDAQGEAPETFRVALSEAGGGGTLVSPGTATVIISDDDPMVQFAQSSYVAKEGMATAAVAVRRSGSLATAMTVRFAATAGTATPGEDFQPVSGTLTFAPGVATRLFRVPLGNDTQREDAETVVLALAEPMPGDLGPQATALLTISDDDPLLGFGAEAFTILESAPTATITVKRSGSSAGTVSVHYTASGGTATADSDYVPVSGTLTFGPGVMTRSFQVPLFDDAVAEEVELVTVSLDTPGGGAGIGRGTALLMLTDDEPRIRFADSITRVGEAGTGITITVLRSSPGRGTVSVDYATADGTATAGSDYIAASGRLTFAPGVLSRTFKLVLVPDGVDETDESVTLSLANPSDGTGLKNPSSMVVVIRDDD